METESDIRREKTMTMTSYPARYHKTRYGFEAEFPDIPHSHACGRTLGELRQNAAEVLTDILNDYLTDGEELPKPTEITGKKILLIEADLDILQQHIPTSSDNDFEELLASVRAVDPEARYIGLLALRSTRRKRAREAMITLLSDTSDRVRAGAVLGILGQGAVEAVPDLKKMLSDSDAFVRVVTIMALCDLDLSSGPLIAPLLNDSDERVRSYACTALAGLHYRDAIPSMRTLLNDPDTMVRAGACYALGRLGDTASESKLMEATDDSDISVRYEAARALFSLGHPKGREVLEEIIARKESPGFIKTRCFLSTVRYILKGNPED